MVLCDMTLLYPLIETDLGRRALKSEDRELTANRPRPRSVFEITKKG